MMEYLLGFNHLIDTIKALGRVSNSGEVLFPSEPVSIFMVVPAFFIKELNFQADFDQQQNEWTVLKVGSDEKRKKKKKAPIVLVTVVTKKPACIIVGEQLTSPPTKTSLLPTTKALDTTKVKVRVAGSGKRQEGDPICRAFSL